MEKEGTFLVNRKCWAPDLPIPSAFIDIKKKKSHQNKKPVIILPLNERAVFQLNTDKLENMLSSVTHCIHFTLEHPKG